MAQDLFIELFPINIQHIPQMTAYAVDFDTMLDCGYGEQLARRLSRTFPGQWVWTGSRIVTDAEVSPVQMDITLDVLQSELPDVFAHLKSIAEDSRWKPTAADAADYFARTVIRDTEAELREALKPLAVRVKNGTIIREYQLRTWAIVDIPAISLIVQSHLLYQQTLQQYIATHPKTDVTGLMVMDCTSRNRVAKVNRVAGKMKAQREKLLAQNSRDAMQRMIREAADDEIVVEVQSDEVSLLYPARALQIIVDTRSMEVLEQFDIPHEQVVKAMQVPPSDRAKMVRTVSDVLKNKGLIDNAFNSRKFGDLFATLEEMPRVQYANVRVNTYKPQSVTLDFVQHGLFARHPRFKDVPIKLGVINTLDTIASDFLEAMRRKIEKDFGFDVTIIKERQVRVVNQKNLASAVRAVEGENPHMILAFLPDSKSEVDPNSDYLKSMTLGKGIASHAVYESTMHNPNEMSRVIMGVLAKTGNVPYALAEPLEHFQRVVGLDFVREKTTQGDRVVAMSRIYKNEGMFMRYYMESAELETGANVPASLIEKLFPAMFFKGKSVIIHHDGTIPADVLNGLQTVAKKLNAEFFPVEIMRRNVPRIYALNNGITQPKWGTLFRLNEFEAFVVSSVPTDNRTPEPLYVRLPLKNAPVDLAVYSVLAWTLFHYGSPGMPKLPVTIQHADDLAEWLSRGMLPDKTEGDVPFWL